ncbi:MAG: hypothetical protein ACRDZ7_00665 [Acidimicrobiia bacterium]
MDNGKASKRERPTVPPVIRGGCLALALTGVVSLFLTATAILNPKGVQCSIAKALIEDANDDGRDFNDVDIGGREARDVDCDEAITLAGTIRRSEGGDETRSVPGASLIRNRGLMSSLVGIGQVIGGFMTLGTLQRRYRTAALVFSILGVVVPVLGLVTVAILGFVVYALGFSSVARELWPQKPRGAS